MNDKPETKIGYVSPLKRICMTIGELPTSYLETMTYYEMLVWFVEFLKNQVIPVVNNNSEATEELQHLFIELQSYVNNYFENLDVQEEINNKLDEMLEDGVLEQIIEQFLQLTSLICFDNVQSMKESPNLTNGSFAKTLGYYIKNDGGEATYKITDEESETEYQEELENGLYASLIVDNYINVKQIGAKGDGASDDTNKIQQVINKGGSIYLSDGNYLISSPLEIVSGVKSIVLSQDATITTNSIIESIILINSTSENLIITGGTINCNSKAKKGIYSTANITSPTFKDIMIKNATECGLQIKDEQNIGSSCHGYLDRVKVYNKNTLATCIGLYAHDMQITDCELFYTNCGIKIRADMQTITGVHIWAGGKDNPNSNTYGIKHEPSNNDTQLALNNIYFDGMNTCIYSTKGKINMDNIIFFNPSEGTYNNPVALLSKDTYSTLWRLGAYYLEAVVPMGLMDYENFDSNNIVTNTNIISEYNNKWSIFKENYIDFGCNYNFLTKKYIPITNSYTTRFITGKYYLFGYYCIKNTTSFDTGNIELKITNKLQSINHKISINFSYNSQDKITINGEKITALNKNYRNPSFGVSLGNIEEKTSIYGNTIKVIPLYLYYDGEATDFISQDSFMIENLAIENPSCLMLFSAIKQENDISLFRTYRLGEMYDGVLNQNASTKVFITQKSVYKLIIYDYGNGNLYNTFAEYNVARYTSNISIVKVFENVTTAQPTITFDETTEMLTISAPSSHWYYVKCKEL